MRKTLSTLVAVAIMVSFVLSACAAPATQAPQAPQDQPTTAPEEKPTAVAEEKPTEAVQPTAIPVDPNKVTIRWFVGLGTGTDPNQVEIENKIVEEFNASHPNINLIIEIVNYNGARDTLSTEIASGNPPDIVGPVGVSGAEAFHGQWLDLTSLIEKTQYDLAQFDKGSVDFYKVGGEGQIGLPFAIFPSLLYYQTEMFDEAGLAYPPQKYGEKYTWPDGTEEEWNFDTLRKLAMKLTVDANGKDATDPAFDPTQIVQYGYEPQYQDARAIGSYFKAGSAVAEDGKTAQIPAEWTEAWKWVYNGVWVDHFIPNLSVRESAEFGTGNPFNSGKVAMALTHLWYTCCLTDAGEAWNVAVVPSYNGQVTANFNADTFRILKDTKHPDEAFEVLSYLLGDASLELLGVYGGMPARLADQKTFFEKLDTQFPYKVNWQVAVDGIAYADNPSFEGYMPNYNESFDRLNTFLSLLMSTEGLDVNKEIETLKSDLQVIFSK